MLCDDDPYSLVLKFVQLLVGEVGAMMWIANTGEVYSKVISPCITVIEWAGGHEDGWLPCHSWH
jgi:hypothetical protein